VFHPPFFILTCVHPNWTKILIRTRDCDIWISPDLFEHYLFIFCQDVMFDTSGNKGVTDCSREAFYPGVNVWGRRGNRQIDLTLRAFNDGL